MCSCNCELCADQTECEITYWCEKLNKYCVAKPVCTFDMMKIQGCYKQLKQKDLFEDL